MLDPPLHRAQRSRHLVPPRAKCRPRRSAATSSTSPRVRLDELGERARPPANARRARRPGCAALGVESAIVPPSFPLIAADRLRAAGFELRPDRETFVDGGGRSRRLELAGIRRAQAAAEAGAWPYYDDNLWIALGLVEAEPRRAGHGLAGDGARSSSRSSATAGTRSRRTRAPAASSGRGSAPTTTATRSRRRTRRCSRSALRASGIAAYLDVGADGLRLDEALPRHAETASSPTTSTSAATVDPHTWSYNQGAMIAAGVRLYRATGERRYLATPSGPRRRAEDDRRPARLGRAAGLPRDLLPRPARARARRSRAATTARRSSGSPTRPGRAHATRRPVSSTSTGRGPTLLDQAAMVQVYAELAASLTRSLRAGRRSALRPRTARSRRGGACRSRSGPGRRAGRPRR